MDTILLQSTIQTLTHNFKAEDITDYSSITYFSDSQSVLKLEGPLATLYNNTNFASPDFNYPGTLSKNINIPLISGSIPNGTYVLTATTRVYKTAVPILSVNTGANSILVNAILGGNFIPGQSITWTGGANAGTYTVASATTGAFGVDVVLVETLVGSSTTGSLSFFELVTTEETYTYCYQAPSTVLTLSADCPTARLAVTNSTNYTITCEGETIQPDSATATLVLDAPSNSGGSPVYPQVTTLLPSGSTYYTTELWTQTWTGTLTTVLVYTLPSGLIINTTIVGTKSLNVQCDDSLCCMSSCLQNATNTFLAAISACGGNLNQTSAALVQYTKILGAFMMYSVGVKCGNTTIIAEAVARMKSYLASTDCCNDCSDNGQSTQIVAIYNVVISGSTLIVQSGDDYIDISESVVGDVTTATFTLNVTQVENLINTYLTDNPSVITDIVEGMSLRTYVSGVNGNALEDIPVKFTGDYTSGSNIITNVSFGSGINQNDYGKNEQIYSPDLPIGSYILSIATNGDITVSNDFNNNGTGQNIEIKSVVNGMSISKWKRTVSGIVSYMYLEEVLVQSPLSIDGSTGEITFEGLSHLFSENEGGACPADVNTDFTITMAPPEGYASIVMSCQLTTTTPGDEPTTYTVSILKNGSLINTTAKYTKTQTLSEQEMSMQICIVTGSTLSGTDSLKVRVAPVNGAMTISNIATMLTIIS